MQIEKEVAAEPKDSGTAEAPANVGNPSPPSGRAVFVTGALKFLAWMNLIICILGSIWIFRELGVRVIPEEESLLGFTEKIVNPFGVALSLAVFLQGIFGCVFLLAFALLAENTTAIRRALSRAGEGRENAAAAITDGHQE
ncbi:MAG: hypothetical protein PHG91_10620 [Syntrophales bacterium]|nr:hypothetical protein [Syntrophales bacterium]